MLLYSTVTHIYVGMFLKIVKVFFIMGDSNKYYGFQNKWKKNSSVGSTKPFITWRYSAEHKRIEWTTTRLPKVPAHYGHFCKNQSINSETIFALGSSLYYVSIFLEFFWPTHYVSINKVPVHYCHFCKNLSINSETIFAWVSKPHHVRLTLRLE